jgi:cell division septum initiation protein DivIVA
MSGTSESKEDHVKEAARSEAPENDVATTSNFLRDPKLRRQLFGGYSIEDTDALLERAAATVDKLRKTVTTLRQQAAATPPAPTPGAVPPAPEPAPAAAAPAPAPAAEAQPAPAPADPQPAAAGAAPVNREAAVQVGEVMITAHQAIELLKEKAQREAERIVDEAHGHAAAILAEAAKERARIEDERTTAGRLVEEARLEAARIVHEAQRERDGILANSERLRIAAEDLRRSWISQVSQVIEQLGPTPAPAASPSNGVSAADIERELIARVQGGSADAPAPEDERAPEQP